MHTYFWWGNLKEGDGLETFFRGRIILKRILKTFCRDVVWISFAQGSSCEHTNGFHIEQGDYWLSQQDSAPWSQLTYRVIV